MNVILELLLRIVRFVIDKISDVIYFILYEESEHLKTKIRTGL